MNRTRHRPRDHLTPDAKARLRKAYADPEVTVATISRRFGLSAETIAGVARREGWPMRKAREERAGT